jgi:hypothetical protein
MPAAAGAEVCGVVGCVVKFCGAEVFIPSDGN